MNKHDSTGKKPVIAHSLVTWLEPTMTWIYNQITHEKKYGSLILSHIVKNTGSFPWTPIYSIPNKANLYAFKLLRKLNVSSYPSVYGKAIEFHKPRILHSHFGDVGWRDLDLAKKYKMKHVVTFYGYDINMLPQLEPVWKKRYRDLFKRVDLVLCEGPHMARCAVSLGCEEKKVKVQRLGVEIDKIAFIPRTLADDGQLKILIAGTFREKKGITYALLAVSHLRKKYPNIRVTVIGDATQATMDLEEKREILKTITQNDLNTIVTMKGFQPHHVLMEEAYKHHIFLSPSVTASTGDAEGGAPVIITEMVASGMPVVSTIHCDIPEVIKHGETGLLADERDVEGLVAHLSWLMENQSSWHSMLQAGRKLVESDFNAVKQGTKLTEIYDNLLTGNV